MELEAICALQYEGSPAEITQNLKEQGNEQVKAKRWKDAKEFYTKGLVALSKKIGSQSEWHGEGKTSSQGEKDIEARRMEELEEACYINRALCNLELSAHPKPPSPMQRLGPDGYRELSIHHAGLRRGASSQLSQLESILPLVSSSTGA